MSSSDRFPDDTLTYYSSFVLTTFPFRLTSNELGKHPPRPARHVMPPLRRSPISSWCAPRTPYTALCTSAHSATLAVPSPPSSTPPTPSAPSLDTSTRRDASDPCLVPLTLLCRATTTLPKPVHFADYLSTQIARSPVLPFPPSPCCMYYTALDCTPSVRGWGSSDARCGEPPRVPLSRQEAATRRCKPRLKGDRFTTYSPALNGRYAGCGPTIPMAVSTPRPLQSPDLFSPFSLPSLATPHSSISHQPTTIHTLTSSLPGRPAVPPSPYHRL